MSKLTADRCLNCPELLSDNYGCTKECKCCDCLCKERDDKHWKTVAYHEISYLVDDGKID